MPFMATCSNCRSEIVFGGLSVGSLAFCSPRCRKQYEQFEVQLKQAGEDYQRSLARLRLEPTNPAVKQATLEAGRIYSSLTRRGQGFAVTLFDEMALSNDIQAACAAAAAPTPAALPPLSIEDRLARLQSLHGRGLISEPEYQAKRAELIKEL